MKMSTSSRVSFICAILSVLAVGAQIGYVHHINAVADSREAEATQITNDYMDAMIRIEMMPPWSSLHSPSSVNQYARCMSSKDFTAACKQAGLVADTGVQNSDAHGGSTTSNNATSTNLSTGVQNTVTSSEESHSDYKVDCRTGNPCVKYIKGNKYIDGQRIPTEIVKYHFYNRRGQEILIGRFDAHYSTPTCSSYNSPVLGVVVTCLPD